MSDRGDAITRQVRADLLDHLRDLQKQAPRYIEEYVESLVGPQTTRRPKPHMHPKLAELVRELALDASAMDRRGVSFALATEPRGAVSPPTHATPFTRRTGVFAQAQPPREKGR